MPDRLLTDRDHDTLRDVVRTVRGLPSNRRINIAPQQRGHDGGWRVLPDCKIKNLSGAAVGAFSVLAIDSPVLDPDAYQSAQYGPPMFNGIAPSTASLHYGRFCVVQRPAPYGAIVPAVMAGVTWAYVNVVHTADRACDITDGIPDYLTSSAVGTARIIYKPGTGTQRCLIRVGDPITEFFGKPNATIAAGGTGQINIWLPSFSGSALGNSIANVRNHGSTSMVTTDKVSGAITDGICVAAKL